MKNKYLIGILLAVMLVSGCIGGHCIDYGKFEIDTWYNEKEEMYISYDCDDENNTYIYIMTCTVPSCGMLDDRKQFTLKDCAKYEVLDWGILKNYCIFQKGGLI